MIVLFSIGVKDGGFLVDTEARKILETIVINEDSFKTNFPKLDEYSYSDLEKIMNFYLDLDDENCLDLEKIVLKIREEGFFYPLRPGLKIEIKEYKSGFI